MWYKKLSRTRYTPRRSRPACACRTSLERLEDRQLLSAAEFELSSLLPANGGDGSTGFVVDGILANNNLGLVRSSQAVGDINGDGTDDFFLRPRGARSSLSPSVRCISSSADPVGFRQSWTSSRSTARRDM